MAFIQFPWRFLAISIFTTSLLGAVVVDNIKWKPKIIFFVFFTFLIFWLVLGVHGEFCFFHLSHFFRFSYIFYSYCFFYQLRHQF